MFLRPYCACFTPAACSPRLFPSALLFGSLSLFCALLAEEDCRLANGRAGPGTARPTPNPHTPAQVGPL